MATHESASERDTAIDRALARAVVARFLAETFGPRSSPQEAGAAQAGLEALEAAAAVLDRPPVHGLAASARTLSAGSGPATGARERLFGHTLRGTVCPYESEYGSRALIQQAHELADLAGFYEAFGLKVGPAHRERPDHVACELDFLGFLSRKEAYALAKRDTEMLEVTRQAIGKFLSEHLGRFGRAFAVSLQSADADGHYGRVGRLSEAFLAAECAWFGVPLGPAMLELRSTVEEGVPMACGSSADLVQIGGLPDLEDRDGS